MRGVTQPILVDRIVYATITIMSVLIIYDGWQDLRLVDVIGVIVGPVVAMFLAHVFSASLARQVDLGRALTSLAERLHPLRVRDVAHRRSSCHPVARGHVTRLSGLPRAHRAGAGTWRVLTQIAAGLILGMVILLPQVALQPGKAFSGGIALG
jgi:hypothetical protein